jgi:hypothetical protein
MEQVSGKAGLVLGVISQSNLAIGGIIQLVALYKGMRAAWRESNPGQPDDRGGWLEDAQLIDLLAKDSDALQTRAAELLSKYAPAPFAPGAGNSGA